MRRIEHSFQQFIDAIHTADDEAGFERVAARVAQNLGFRWFAYLCLNGDTSTLISSYPKSWTRRYFNLSYQHLDPVVRRARAEHDLFSWGGGASAPAGNREQRKFFEEATTFGIKSGITVPIRGGFGRTAAFTLATDEATALSERFVAESKDVLQLVGIYFHTHVTARSSPGPGSIWEMPAASSTRARSRSVSPKRCVAGCCPESFTSSCSPRAEAR